MPISSVVLSSQRVDLKDALFDAMKSQDKLKEAANPLVSNNSKLIPSVTRVFNRGRELYVYFQAYQPAAAAAKPYVGFVTLFRDHQKVYETQAVAVTQPEAARLTAVPMSFDIGLSHLAPGEYTCQVYGARSHGWKSQLLAGTGPARTVRPSA